MVANTRAETSSTKSAANVGVKARNDVETPQASDLKPLHLRHRRDQDVGSLVLRQVHRPSAERAPVPTPVAGVHAREIQVDTVRGDAKGMTRSAAVIFNAFLGLLGSRGLPKQPPVGP